VFLSALDASKAFDKIVHSRLIDKLKERSVPMCLIACISNWYGKLYGVVKWENCCSEAFAISCGVRQGGVLSPSLFNVYVDELICLLESKSMGCHIGTKFYACIMYADDVIILAASVSELQKMLDVCHAFAVKCGISFNATKSICVKVGQGWTVNVDDMKIGDTRILWASQFKYLGVNFIAKTRLTVDVSPVRRKFYTAVNSILSSCGSAAENVKVYMINAFCLPLLTYCLGALDLSTESINCLSVCLNDAFRKIFSMNKWESVSCIQYYCNILSFKFLCDLHKWNFLFCSQRTCSHVSYLISIIDYNVLGRFAEKYEYSGSSKIGRKLAVYDKFELYCLDVP
jgi:hypothetical protein